jgi:prepilin-type N-terminal cleavage/methylation domain-containing protein
MKTNPSSAHPLAAPRSPHSRFTFHASRNTQHAFTLIELLIVIAIIGIIAGFIFVSTKAINRQKIQAKARAELATVESAIINYQTKLGHYPPDNPDSPWRNQLYYELLGVNLVGPNFVTLDGTAQIPAASVSTWIGPQVGGFVNLTTGSGDEGHPAIAFLKGLKPGQSATIAPPGTPPGLTILACSVPWPANLVSVTGNNDGVNPVCYNSSAPVNNPESFDLWIDVVINNQTNRVCNWSKQILIQ